MARAASRTRPRDRSDARTRLEHARKFLEVAKLVAHEDTNPASRSVAAAVAVLAGIAASDASCCAVLGLRSRGQDHQEAADLLEQVTGGKDAAKALRELISLKDTAHYGLTSVSQKELTRAIRRAAVVVDFAGQTLR